MCGIVAYTGKSNILEILIDGIKKLEYRGYDSAGVSLVEHDKERSSYHLHVVKEKGEISRLEKKIAFARPEWSAQSSEQLFSCGIAHTRWATLGVPSETNAHPHVDCSKTIAVVHNGIIENHASLKRELEAEGHLFTSETDSEVPAHLFEKYYREYKESKEYKKTMEEKEKRGNKKEYMKKSTSGDDPVKEHEFSFLYNVARKTVEKLDGSYALVFIHTEHPNILIAVRNRSPLVIGVGEADQFAASDVSPFLPYTRDTIFLEDGDIAICDRKNLTIWDVKGEVAVRELVRIEWDIDAVDKGGYKHFMLKEIFEQKIAIHESIGQKIGEFMSDTYNDLLSDLEKVEIIACGTSYHAALIGKYFFERIANVPVHVYRASEYRYSPRVGHRGLAVAISQSGETADTIAAIESAGEFGHRTLAITNILGSTITRVVDRTIYMVAGPEIGVAATKTFTNQLIVLYLLGMKMAVLHGAITPDQHREMIKELRELPRSVQFVLGNSERIKEIAEKFAHYQNMLFIGRNIHFPVALEGALKLKEISYIHAEGYPAGELKHGPIALLSKQTPTVAVVVKDHTYDKTMSNIGEVVARDSPVVIVAEEADEDVSMYSDDIIRIPGISSYFAPVPASIALQLFAYYIADARGCDIDKPRNLAKSVTVE